MMKKPETQSLVVEDSFDQDSAELTLARIRSGAYIRRFEELSRTLFDQHVARLFSQGVYSVPE